jgi:hypothetical protein
MFTFRHSSILTTKPAVQSILFHLNVAAGEILFPTFSAIHGHRSIGRVYAGAAQRLVVGVGYGIQIVRLVEETIDGGDWYSKVGNENRCSGLQKD